MRKSYMQAWQLVAGVIGLVGSIGCAVAMTLAAIGVVGASAASAGSMADMGADSTGGFWGALLQYGPAILVVSIAAMTLALGVQRPIAIIPAVLAGALLYWGMYDQDRLPVMYAAIVIGFLAWASLFLWVRGLPWRSAPESST
jgi:hypothetical protein